MSVDARTVSFGGRTAWGRNLAAPVRDFLSAETSGAATPPATEATAPATGG